MSAGAGRRLRDEPEPPLESRRRDTHIAEISYYGRVDDSGRLVGLFRVTLGGTTVVKGELLGPRGWMIYPDLLRYMYVTGEVTAMDKVTPQEARVYIAERGAKPDELDLGVA